jgi:regulator of protease activity HflC (stomatin/prohibitin superfamily)
MSEKVYAVAKEEHISLGKSLRGVLFFIPVLILFLTMVLGVPPSKRELGILRLGVLSAVWGVVVSGVRVAAQWERGVMLRLGRFHGVRGPGVFYVLPILEYVRFLDTRTLVVNIPRQKVITRDNVPAEIDSALFFLVRDAEKAVNSIQDFRFAIAQYSQAALRDVVGGLTLDELLSEREQIQLRIVNIVEERVQNWGLHMESVSLQDIELPEDLKRMMSRQASAEREKRATITKAEGDKMAAVSLAEAASIMASNPIALELRTLQTIDGLGSSPSNTVILFPIELGNVLKTLPNNSSSQ